LGRAADARSELYLGFDVGTQSTKALLVDAGSQRVVARASAAYGLIEGLPEGAAEQSPETWIEAARKCSAQLFAGREAMRARVAGVGVSGQQHGLVVLDEEERVVRPAKLWCDTSTADEARELSAALGRHVPAGYTASKILWLARREPERWARVRRVMLPHDYVNFRLTGRAATDAGDASGTGYFDARGRCFDLAACARIDARLGELLPELVEAGRAAGELSLRGAELLGLRAGIPVAAGSGDNMLSAFGSGATRPGVAVVSLGTSGTVFARSTELIDDPTGAVAPFCDATGAYLPLLCVMNATGLPEEVKRAFAVEHAQLTREAADVPAGCRGVIWLPYLQGERVPDLPRATGTIAGLRPQSLDRGLLYRAALEGVALNLAWGIERMRRAGVAIENARLVGGAAENELWCQILADVFELPLLRLEESESAALGAALQALWTVRLARGETLSADEVAREFVRTRGRPFEPAAQTSAIYREASARFRGLAGALYPELCARAPRSATSAR
jgi:xylulokinase